MQQFLAIADADDQGIDAAQHAQDAIQARDLGSLALLLTPRMRIIQCPAYRRRQTREIALQYIVDGSAQ